MYQLDIFCVTVLPEDDKIRNQVLSFFKKIMKNV